MKFSLFNVFIIQNDDKKNIPTGQKSLLKIKLYS